MKLKNRKKCQIKSFAESVTSGMFRQLVEIVKELQIQVQVSTSPATQVSNDSSSDMLVVSSDMEDIQYQATTESI